jgi:GNAT superfamily N-acetyltransferase
VSGTTDPDGSLLLVEAGVVWGEDDCGRVAGGTVLAVGRTTAGRVVSRPGNTGPIPGEATQTSGCVSFLVESPLPVVPLATGYVLRTDDPDGWLAARRPPEWDEGEWPELLAGRLGPWAVATTEAEVASLCHCARLTAAGAEAGVFTNDAHRGKGLARAVTVAWAEAMSERGIPLFYSTSEENRASQKVAERLGLRGLGRLWRVFTAEVS